MTWAAKKGSILDSGVLIIGAGPFGLSISAYLSKLGVDHTIVGRPMDTWRAHMPLGMCLKSEPYGSSFASPQPGSDIAAFCASRGLEYVARGGPLALERFLRYGDWFAEKLVPDIRDETVTEVAAIDGGFSVTFAAAAPMRVRQVVIATGVLPYADIPEQLAGLSRDLVTHTSDHHLLDKFSGRRVAVVGAGQSALETAALLHEQGADVRLIVRGDSVRWLDANPEHLGPVQRIRRPVTNLCEGWHCVKWNSPAYFRRKPVQDRMYTARTALGPAGAWWLRDRVHGVVETLTSTTIREASAEGSGVRLALDGPREARMDVDHVMCGTGFPVDIARLPFLPEELRARITSVGGHPMLSRAGESSIPGLYFAGVSAAASLGVSMRFVAGTHNVARVLARSVRSSRARRH
jgi:FAD-dependent urate hydroxylase